MHRVKRSRRWLLGLLWVGAGILVCLYRANASWIAAPGRGVPRVIAQRGVAQTYSPGKVTNDTCTAGLILPPSHTLIDNTVPSIEAAIEAGADVVEIDIRATRDHQFVLFHDVGLACRTDGSGRVSEHSVAELQTLDVGYGYTADGGKSFPLRGKGVGLMPTLAEVLRKYPDQRFLVQIKDGAPSVADSLLPYLSANGLEASERLTFFGVDAPLARLRSVRPGVRTWSVRASAKCLMGYLETGWFGRVPQVCDGGVVVVPIEQAYWLWGWPNRFLSRMRRHGTEVMLIGTIDSISSGEFSRLDTLRDLSRVPAGFDGFIWTDQVGIIGPAVHKRPAYARMNTTGMSAGQGEKGTSDAWFVGYRCRGGDGISGRALRGAAGSCCRPGCDGVATRSGVD